jgi:hypothetical protein
LHVPIKMNAQKIEINTGSLPPGIYVLATTDKNLDTWQTKFIIER